MTSATPPVVCERVLGLVVRHDHFLDVSGDLLETYRETICPARGRRGADRWYAWQVAQFVWIAARPWSILLATLFVGRTALDWFLPPNDFSERAMLTTWLSAAIVALAAMRAAARCRAVASGVFAAGACVAFAAPFSIAGVSLMLGLWHDAATLSAVRNSGGLLEALTLPILLTIPAVLVGGFAGLVGVGASAVRALRS